MAVEEFPDRILDLRDRLATDVRQDQRLIVDFGYGLLLDDLDE
jgi:hypothetical protein